MITPEASPARAGSEDLEIRVDRRRWQQVREICKRLAGREVSDVDCLMMVTEHYLMRLGLHTRAIAPTTSVSRVSKRNTPRLR